MSESLKTIALIVMLVCAPAVANADNNPSLTGRGAAEVGLFSWDVKVTAVQQKDGKIVGRLKLERLFDGQPNWSVDAPVSQLVIDGNRAYGTAGNFLFVIEDNGEGANAPADRFLVINFVSGAPELTPIFLASPLFTNPILWSLLSVQNGKGNFQVRD